MNEQEAREYSESLGQIFDGGYRQAAWADKQKIPQALGVTMREWVMTYLGGYVRMSVEQRNAAILELATEGTSQKGIARALGLAHETVSAVVKDEPTIRERDADRDRPWPSERAEADTARPVDEGEADTARPVETEPEGAAWGQILKGAAKAAHDDPLANVYAALKALALIKVHLDPAMFGEEEEIERLRVYNSIEEGIATLRRVQQYAQERAEVSA